MQSTELDEKYFLERAHKRVENKDYKRAINDFTRALRINPKNDEIYLLRAEAKVKSDLLKKALEDFNLYLEKNSQSIYALLRRGDCHLKLNSRKLALKDYNQADQLGSEEGSKKKLDIESYLEKVETSIKNLSLKLKEDPKDAKGYFLRAMEFKKQPGFDHKLIIKDLEQSILLDSNFEEAYFELHCAKISCNQYSSEEIASDLEKYHKIRRLREFAEANEAHINDIDERTKNNPLTREKLLFMIKALSDQYSEEQIGIASGYFYKKDKIKIFDRDKFLEAKEFAINSCKEQVDKDYLYLDGLSIFKNRFCILDGEHGGTVFITSRIVNQTKEWDYSNADLKDWEVKTIINDESHSAFGEDEEDAKEWMEIYSFNEPMKYIQVEQYSYLDEKLNVEEWFTAEEQADFYGLRYEDCDPKSSWCDG